jgi:hypothetical protein
MDRGVQGPLGCKPSTILCSKCPTDAVAWTERDCRLDMSRRGHRTYRDVLSSFYSVNKHLTTSGTGETSDSGRPTDAVAWTERDCRLDMSRRGHRTYRDVLSSFYSVNKHLTTSGTRRSIRQWSSLRHTDSAVYSALLGRDHTRLYRRYPGPQSI